MLEDIILSDSIRYEAHTLIADMPSAEPIRIKGAFGAALMCALLVDSEEGNRRAIAIDSDEDKQAWIKRYEREVRQRICKISKIALFDRFVSIIDICLRLACGV